MKKQLARLAAGAAMLLSEAVLANRLSKRFGLAS